MRNKRPQYEKWAESEDLTEEAKQRLAQESYQAYAPKVEELRKKAREELLGAAKVNEKFSIPMPPTEAHVSTDATKVLLDQNEGARTRSGRDLGVFKAQCMMQ